MEIYEKIRVLRESKGYTQAVMAEKLNCSLQNYGKIERGESKKLSIETVERIAHILGLSLMELLAYGDNQELDTLYALLKRAFDTQNISLVRELFKSTGIKARLRHLHLDNAEARLEISREEIIRIIRTYQVFRLRHLKETTRLVIEEFEVNKPYGSLIDRKSPVTIIATQNYSDAGIGHFSATLAKTLRCNYIANEFFSTGAPLQERHINFAQNPVFLNFNPHENESPALKEFIEDIQLIDSKTKSYLYLTTSDSTYKNDLHLLYRGDKENTFDSPKATYANLSFLKGIYEKVRAEWDNLGYRVGTHEELAFQADDSLPNALHNHFKKDVLVFCVSTKILWLAEDMDYYQAMVPVITAIREIMKKHPI